MSKKRRGRGQVTGKAVSGGLAEFGAFEKKRNGFRDAALPEPPKTEDEGEHVSRKLRAVMALQAGVGVLRPGRAPAAVPVTVQRSEPKIRKRDWATAVEPTPVSEQGVQADEPPPKKARPVYLSRRQRRLQRTAATRREEEDEQPVRPAFGDVVSAPPSITLKLKRASIASADDERCATSLREARLEDNLSYISTQGCDSTRAPLPAAARSSQRCGRGAARASSGKPQACRCCATASAQACTFCQ
jgi:hypothetical protein